MVCKLIIFFSILLQVECAYHAFRQIPGRVPIIANETLSAGFTTSLEDCKKECPLKGCPDFVFGSLNFLNNKAACICLPKNAWYKHGLVTTSLGDLYISLSVSAGNEILNNFLLLDTHPMRGKIETKEILKTISIEECALTCFNYVRKLSCNAFEFDVLTNICNMYSGSHLRDGDFRGISQERGVNTLYFEKLSEHTRSFIPMPRKKLDHGHEPRKYNSKWLPQCSEICVLSPNCLSFNYYPKKRICEIMSQTRHEATTLASDDESIHFEMIPSTGCGEQRNNLKEGLIRSPGWPYDLSEKFMNGTSCSWDVLTSWGRTVQVQYIFFKLELESGECKQTLKIGNSRKECPQNTPSSKSFKQTGEVTTFALNVKEWPATKQDGERIGFLMKYSLNWATNSEFKNTGVIASPKFPELLTSPTSSTYKIIANSQKVLIKFLSFNLQGRGVASEIAKITFSTLGNPTITCEGSVTVLPCKMEMIFVNVPFVNITFDSGNYGSSNYPPGFKLLYVVGDAQRILPELNVVDEMTLSDVTIKAGRNIVNHTNLQERYSTVNYTLRIRNPEKDGKVELRILKLFLLPEASPNCTQDRLRVIDPRSSYVNYTFCGQSAPVETITSIGNELIVQVKVVEVPFTKNYKPERSFVIQAMRRSDKPGELKHIDSETSIQFPEKMLKYPPNSDITWVINSPENLEPKLILRHATLAEFNFLGNRFCDNDRLSITFGSGSLVTCGANESLTNKEIFTNDNMMKIHFASDDIISAAGFLVDVEMIQTKRCKPSEMVKVKVDETDYLMSETYPVAKSSGNCLWQVQAENSTGVIVTVCEGGKLSIESPEGSPPSIVLGNTYHIPVDSIITWSANGGKFLAKVQSEDLTTTTSTTTMEPTTPTTTPTTTTMAPTTTMTTPTTTMMTTTTTTTRATTAAPTTVWTTVTDAPSTTLRSTTTFLPQGPPKTGANTGDAPMKIGLGVGAGLAVVFILLIISWKVYQRRNRDPLIEVPKRFVDNRGFKPMDEVIASHKVDQAFENPAYVEHQPRLDILESEFDEGDSVYVAMEDNSDRDFSHLDTTVNSFYGTSNPYEDEYGS